MFVIFTSSGAGDQDQSEAKYVSNVDYRMIYQSLGLAKQGAVDTKTNRNSTYYQLKQILSNYKTEIKYNNVLVTNQTFIKTISLITSIYRSTI